MQKMKHTSQSSLKTFFSAYPLQRYKKHTSVIREGDTYTKIFLIKSGFVRLYSLTKNGKELSLHIYAKNQYFPTLISLSDEISNHYFEAQSLLEVYAVPKEKFIEFIKNNPTLLFDLAERGGKMISYSLKHLEMLATECAYFNVSSILYYLCSVYHSNTNACEIPLSHQEIASWINTTRETVTREIQKLVKKGIVTGTHRHIIIKDLDKLKAEIK